MESIIIEKTNLYEGDNLTGLTSNELLRYRKPITVDFHLVKIISSRFADSYLNGNLKFGTLASYRHLNIDYHQREKKESNNSIGRYDLFEGVLRISDMCHDPFYKGFCEDFKRNISALWYVAREIDVAKAHSLFALDDQSIKLCIRPSTDFATFGDRAIFILDKNTFINRIRHALSEQSKKDNCQYILGIGPIVYLKPFPTHINLTPFVKYAWFKWQQEFRLLIIKIEADGTPSVVNQDLFLNIGDIQDIAVNMPINEFLRLGFLPSFLTDAPLSTQNLELTPQDFKEFYHLDTVNIDFYTRIGDNQHNCILKSDGMIFQYNLYTHELNACNNDGRCVIVEQKNNPFL